MLRGLLVEAAQIAVRFDPEMKKQCLHRCHQKPKGVAKVAAARQLAVRLYWMPRTQVVLSRDRSYRDQPAGAPGRRKLDRRIDWVLSHPEETGCSRRRIMAAVSVASMVGGTIFHRE